MEYATASNFREVQKHISGRVDVFSCFAYDKNKYALMQDDFSTGKVIYLLAEDALYHGYVRLVELNPEKQSFFADDLEGRVALIDIVIPRDIGEEGIEDLAYFLEELGFEHAYLNAEITWVEETLPGARTEQRYVVVPELEVLKHFEEGSGEYTLVDLLAQKF